MLLAFGFVKIFRTLNSYRSKPNGSILVYIDQATSKKVTHYVLVADLCWHSGGRSGSGHQRGMIGKDFMAPKHTLVQQWEVRYPSEPFHLTYSASCCCEFS